MSKEDSMEIEVLKRTLVGRSFEIVLWYKRGDRYKGPYSARMYRNGKLQSVKSWFKTKSGAEKYYNEFIETAKDMIRRGVADQDSFISKKIKPSFNADQNAYMSVRMNAYKRGDELDEWKLKVYNKLESLTIYGRTLKNIGEARAVRKRIEKLIKETKTAKSYNDIQRVVTEIEAIWESI